MDLLSGLLQPDPAIWTLIATLTLPFVAFLARKRIGRFIFTSLIEFARDEFFEEVDVDDGHGAKRRLMRPNAKGGAFLGSVVPGMIDWATKNVKITLPPFNLPENVDLKAVGASVLAQKALSGKKLRIDDAVPLILGYAKDWAENSGILDTLGKPLGKTGTKSKPGKEVANPFTKKLLEPHE